MAFQTDYHKNRISLVDSFVKKLTGMNIISFIKTLNWTDKALAINLINDKLKNEDIVKIYSVTGNEHRMDKRKPEEFFLNIILGWAVEDSLIYYLKKHNINVNFAGTDSERSITNSFVTNVPDLFLPDKNKYVEVVMSYYDGSTTISLRDNKYQNLKMYNSALLSIDLNTEKVILIENINKTKPESAGYNKNFGKNTTNIDISNEKQYNISQIIDVIKKL